MISPVSVKKIAELAGCSPATVSRVLNNKANVHSKTRERVLKIVEREYPQQKIQIPPVNHKIGVVLEDISNPYFSNIAKNIDKRLREAGYFMLLTHSEYDEQKELDLVNTLLSIDVDGIIISAVNPDSKAVRNLSNTDIPFMLVNCKASSNDIDWICSDNVKGGYLATKYLLDKGHPRIAFIKGNAAQPAVERFEGMKTALKERGLLLSEQLVLDYGAATEDDGYRIISNFVEKAGKKDLPSAIFAINDPVAIGVMEALADKGIDVPRNVSVIGYDNIEISKFLKVPLTTVDQSEFYIGEIAASQIIEKHKTGKNIATRKILIKPVIKERESVIAFQETERITG